MISSSRPRRRAPLTHQQVVVIDTRLPGRSDTFGTAHTHSFCFFLLHFAFGTLSVCLCDLLLAVVVYLRWQLPAQVFSAGPALQLLILSSTWPGMSACSACLPLFQAIVRMPTLSSLLSCQTTQTVLVLTTAAHSLQPTQTLPSANWSSRGHGGRERLPLPH